MSIEQTEVPTTVTGMAIRCRQEPVQTELTADATAGATVLEVEWDELFSDEGGTLVLNGVELDYDTATSVDDDASTVTLSAPLAADAAAGDPVYFVDGGQVSVVYEIDVDLGEGDPVPVPIPVAQRPMWPVGEYEDPRRVVIAADYSEIVDVPQWTPDIGPEFFRAGTIRADREISVGDPNGQHTTLTPYYKAYNAANEQTVNLDGQDNFMLGTLATGKEGQARVEIGQGLLFGEPANAVRINTGDADETAPALFSTSVVSGAPVLRISAPELTTTGNASAIELTADPTEGRATVAGDRVDLKADNDVHVTSGGRVVVTTTLGLDATMGDGSIGTGEFRDSVDARLLALLAAFGHSERSASQSIPSGAATVVTYTTSTVAERGGITFSGGVFTVGIAGTYLTKVYTSLPNAGGPRRQCQIRKNGVTGAQTNQTPPTTGVWSAETTECLDYAAGDTIDVRVFQDSGAALTLTSTITVHRLA